MVKNQYLISENEMNNIIKLAKKEGRIQAAIRIKKQSIPNIMTSMDTSGEMIAECDLIINEK